MIADLYWQLVDCSSTFSLLLGSVFALCMALTVFEHLHNIAYNKALLLVKKSEIESGSRFEGLCVEQIEIVFNRISKWCDPRTYGRIVAFIGIITLVIIFSISGFSTQDLKHCPIVNSNGTHIRQIWMYIFLLLPSSLVGISYWQYRKYAIFRKFHTIQIEAFQCQGDKKGKDIEDL